MLPLGLGLGLADDRRFGIRDVLRHVDGAFV